MSEFFDDLKKLAEMRDKGEVTQSEYDKIKAELVAEMGQHAPSDKPADIPSDVPEAENVTQQTAPRPRSIARDAGAWLGQKAPSLSNALPADVPNIMKKRWFWLVVAIILLASLANLGSGSGGSPSGNSPAPPQHEAVEAYVVCQQFVEDQLRAPSTAEFGGPYSQVTTHNGGGEYTVRTYVDAENAFGAMIRNDFTCTVQHTSGDSYRLIDLTMSER